MKIKYHENYVSSTIQHAFIKTIERLSSNIPVEQFISEIKDWNDWEYNDLVNINIINE